MSIEHERIALLESGVQNALRRLEALEDEVAENRKVAEQLSMWANEQRENIRNWWAGQEGRDEAANARWDRLHEELRVLHAKVVESREAIRREHHDVKHDLELLRMQSAATVVRAYIAAIAAVGVALVTGWFGWLRQVG